ncbi:unnamed protein product, partial [Prorocentrum cordatum]
PKGAWANGPPTPDLVASITAAIERKFDQKFKSLKDPKAQVPEAAGGDAAPPGDEQEQRGARIDSLEKALKQLGDVDSSDPARACLEEQLRAARKAQREAKPQLQQHTNVAFRLQAAQRKQAKAAEAVTAQQKVIEAAQKSLLELQEKQAACQREVAALEEELRRTMPAGPGTSSQYMDVKLELPTEVLDDEANADVKQLLSSAAFAKLQVLQAEPTGEAGLLLPLTILLPQHRPREGMLQCR